MPSAPKIHGHCDDRFVRVRDTLQKNFEERSELGASVAVFHDGEAVVDLWGGFRDTEQTRPWEKDTLVNVYSTTKVMAALCLLMLYDRGKLDVEEPVATHWPEFAASGKADIRIKHVLSHTSGLAGWAEPIDVAGVCDWDRSVGMLAAQAPWWEPGTASGYHALTHGHLLGEVVRRVSGSTLGAFFREEVAKPLGADFHIGLPEEHEPRVAPLDPPPPDAANAVVPPADSVAGKVFANPVIRGEMANTRAWRAAEIPAANGQGNARAVARVAGALARGGEIDGIRLLRESTIARAIQPESDGRDLVLGLPLRFGLGWGLTSPVLPMGPSERTFFWGGYGGSLVVMDPDSRIGFAYAMNRMGRLVMGDVRGFSLAMATFQSLRGTAAG